MVSETKTIRQHPIVKCDFTLKHYFDTIDKAIDQGYEIKRISAYCKDCDKILLLRHDVDFSIEYALKLAELESEHNIRTTYHVMVNSPFYNIMSKDNQLKINRIKDLGHEIGFHFDSTCFLGYEPYIIEKIIGSRIKSYSRHLPSITHEQRLVVNNFTNANDLGIKYISDSGRNWREGCFCQWIGREDKMQVLTHPLWWVNQGVRERVIFDLQEDLHTQINNEMINYRQVLKEYDKELSTWKPKPKTKQ